jgi:hypothetical protein
MRSKVPVCLLGFVFGYGDAEFPVSRPKNKSNAKMKQPKIFLMIQDSSNLLAARDDELPLGAFGPLPLPQPAMFYTDQAEK